MTDTFFYSGPIERKSDLDFIEFVNSGCNDDHVNLVLVSPGGDPDAAYKISRYLQERYRRFTVTVPGYCKSAGTLLAIGANDLVFAPYGELGPLDIQMSKVDNVAGMESGLNTSEAFQALEARARGTFTRMVQDIFSSSGGIVSFPTAAHAANEAIASLYGPIFARIDPEEVGSRSRAMRIGQDYGERLNAKGQNLKYGALKKLAQDYSSHGFVIDHLEAQSLFGNVRMATAQEIAVITDLGPMARLPARNPHFDKIDWPSALSNDNSENEDAIPEDEPGGEAQDPSGDGQDSEGAVGA